MTTVAYRDGIMVSDSLGSYGTTKVPGPTQKLFRLKDGSIAGATGSESNWRKLIEWLDTDRSSEQPTPKNEDESATVAVMTPDGRVEIFEGGYRYVESSEFMAFGSGQAAALGALHAGASAEEAVRAACLVDKNSGGELQVMRVKPMLRIVDGPATISQEQADEIVGTYWNKRREGNE